MLALVRSRELLLIVLGIVIRYDSPSYNASIYTSNVRRWGDVYPNSYFSCVDVLSLPHYTIFRKTKEALRLMKNSIDFLLDLAYNIFINSREEIQNVRQILHSNVRAF